MQLLLDKLVLISDLLYAGKPTESKDEVETAARVLLNQGVKDAVLVKRGKNGSLLVTRDDAIEQGIFEAGKASTGLPLLRLLIESLRSMRLHYASPSP